jgi:PPOX class probable FMN-dependent enzyme
MSDYLALWRSHLAHALHRNRAKPYSKYVQLATVNPEGLPTNRTVVFRGFLESTNQLQFIIDTRSKKFIHIQQKPYGEICWYFTKTREQFRLAGNLILVTSEHEDSELLKARRIMWQNISDSARLQFAWANPGEVRESTPEAFNPEPPSETKPLDNFCLLLLEPQKVDHLELRGDPQNRYLYILSSDNSWEIKEINP